MSVLKKLQILKHFRFLNQVVLSFYRLYDWVDCMNIEPRNRCLAKASIVIHYPVTIIYCSKKLTYQNFLSLQRVNRDKKKSYREKFVSKIEYQKLYYSSRILLKKKDKIHWQTKSSNIPVCNFSVSNHEYVFVYQKSFQEQRNAFYMVTLNIKLEYFKKPHVNNYSPLFPVIKTSLRVLCNIYQPFFLNYMVLCIIQQMLNYTECIYKIP